MPKLTVVAHFKARPDQIGFMKAELEKLVGPTRREKGCLQYDLHQDNGNPAHFLFYENWESRETWQAHLKTPHLLAFRAATENAVEEPAAIREMTHIA
jgi:quinol monooxygenase YgiN